MNDEQVRAIFFKHFGGSNRGESLHIKHGDPTIVSDGYFCHLRIWKDGRQERGIDEQTSEILKIIYGEKDHEPIHT